MRLLPYVASTITRYLQIMNSPINADQSLCAQPLSSAAQRKRDRKRIGWLLGPILPATVLGSLLLYRAKPKWHWLTWSTPLLLHVVTPALDYCLGEDQDNIHESDVPSLEQDPYYMHLIRAYIPIQYATTALGVHLTVRANTPWWAKIGLILSTGAVNGMAINVAHELGHKKTAPERRLAQVALAPSLYNHHVIEHHFGHHRHVATPEDPSSARMGEPLWQFMPRSLIGSIRTAVSIERTRLARQQQPFWSAQNEFLQGWTLSALCLGSIALSTRKWSSVPVILSQAIYAGSMLEVVNYLEHYGLLRQTEANGQYERCAPSHSWNSNSLVTNLFLYQLQRHSDHHAHPTRSFQCLRHFEDSPQLPAGYGAMILPAYIPRWWYALMDHRVVAHYGGDISKANLQPSQRARLLARWRRLTNADD
jgi:alkane 1-monooxygenase